MSIAGRCGNRPRRPLVRCRTPTASGAGDLAGSPVACRTRYGDIIARPADGSSVKSNIRIHGAAWAGEAAVTRVDISTDGGATWRGARLASQESRYTWRLWDFVWTAPKAGEYVVMSRATDDQGRTQPQAAAWNPSGYLYNAIDQVKIHVVA